jgi:23S rRNA (guanosine2251-2'-O)-methyltransferase
MGKKSTKTYSVSLILHNIRSTHNVGSIFRTADAAGVSKLYLTGYTPAPLDRFGRSRKDIAKVALGAQVSVPWEHVPNIKILLKKLKKEKIQIVALEQAENSIDYKTFTSKNSIALILGNEVGGIEKSILKLCDKVIEIPMSGKKESLNVSVAAGITLFRILDR